MNTKIKTLEKQLKSEKAKQKWAVFFSPGTFFSESDAVQIKGEINL